MKHPTQEQLLNAAAKLDDAYAMLVSMARQQAAEPVAQKPYAYEYGVDNGDGTYSIQIDRGSLIHTGVQYEYCAPRNPHPEHPVKPLYTHPAPTQQPLTDEQKAALRECRNKAMKWTAQAGIPECAAFGEVAQDLDWLCGQLGIAENEKGGAQ